MKKIKVLLIFVVFTGLLNAVEIKEKEGYDRQSTEFNQQINQKEKEKLAIDRELEEEEAKEEDKLKNLSLKVSDEEKQDYWIVRPQARNLFMAIEKNILIGEVNKANDLVKEFGDFVDLPGSDMAEFSLYNVAKALVFKEYGEDTKSKVSCLRAMKITHGKELFYSQKINAYLTDMFCNDYMPEVYKSESTLIFQRTTAQEYVLSHLKDDKIIKHVKYIKIMNSIKNRISADLEMFKVIFKSNRSKLVAMYGIHSIEKANYLLQVANYITERWMEREETLFILKTGYKMTVKLLRQKYEKNPNNNFLIGKFLMSIADNYYGSISYKQSIPYYEKAAEIFKKNGFDAYLVRSLKNLSYVYRLARNVDKALKTVLITLKEAERVYGKKSVEYGSILIIEADIYNIDKDYNSAIRDLKEARSIFAEKYGEYSNKVKLIDLNIRYVELDEEVSF